jgi:hypothetical protein
MFIDLVPRALGCFQSHALSIVLEKPQARMTANVTRTRAPSGWVVSLRGTATQQGGGKDEANPYSQLINAMNSSCKYMCMHLCMCVSHVSHVSQ